jgi:Flp pilus assembly CpaE family ATPase
VLVSGKGAPGATTLAIGLADVLAERGRRVVLVDADLRGGNVVPYLDLDPTRGILGLGVGRHGAGDALPVGEELQDGPGFMVLAGVEQPEHERGAASELATAAVASLRQMFDEVIVDAGQVVAGNTRAGEALLRAADRVLIVSGSDLVSAWNAQCCAQHLRDCGVPPERLSVLINRREGRTGYGAAEVEQALALPVAAVLPEDRRAARRARAEQLPVTAGGGKVARGLRALAVSLTAETGASARTSRPRRWFARPSRLAMGRK